MRKFTMPGQPGYADHWKYCTRNQVPYVAIKPARKYARVEFDVYEMVKPKGLPDEQPCEFILDLYQNYARFFSLPADKFSCVGGSNNLVFTVHREHAEFFAAQLYDYLVKFIASELKKRKSD